MKRVKQLQNRLADILEIEIPLEHLKGCRSLYDALYRCRTLMTSDEFIDHIEKFDKGKHKRVDEEQKFLGPLSGKITHRDFIAFDIETYGKKNKFLMVSVYADDIKMLFYDKEKFIDWLSNLGERNFKKRRWFVATNLGFDFLGIFANTEYEKELKMVFRGSKLIIAKFRGFTFIDSLNYTFMSVKRMGQYINIEKLDTPKYITETRRPRDDEFDYIEKYCLRDSEITYKFMLFLQDSFNELGAELKMTSASTSMDLYKRRFIPKPFSQPPLHIMQDILKAYYGGRTECFIRGYCTKLYKYDYKSHYPSVMRYTYPDPDSMKIKKNADLSILEYEGVSHVWVKTPPLHIPLLPYRRDGKLLFPQGEFSGWYSHVELRKALQLGHKIKIKKTYYYTRNFHPFQDFVNTLYPLRQELQKRGDPMQLVVKLLMNSLYGKFGQKAEQEGITHIDMLDEKTWKEARLVLIPDSDYIRYTTIAENAYIPAFVNPILALYTTAYGRVKLYEDFERIGLQNVYYCDTDSIFTTKKIESSMELGELCLEAFADTAIIVKPKLYMLQSGEQFEYKAKGVQMGKDKSKTFENILNHRKITQRQFCKFRTSIKSKGNFKINEIIERSKKLDLEDDKRAWQRDFNTVGKILSTPLYIIE